MMSANTVPVEQFVQDLAAAGLELTQPQIISEASLTAVRKRLTTDRVLYSRGTVGYDDYGRSIGPKDPVYDVVQGKRGIRVAGAAVNLMPNGNTDFSNDLTGWTVSTGASTNGAAAASADQAFIGEKCAQVYGGDNSGDYVTFFQEYAWGAGEFTMGFAVYSPYKQPLSDDGLYAYVGSNNIVVTTAKSIPAGKQGWWWVFHTATSDEAARRFGIRVNGTYTWNVDAFFLVAGSVRSATYPGTQKAAETLRVTSREIPKQFVAGVLVRSDHSDAMVKADTAARLLTLRASNGDEYRIEYRPSTKTFAAVKEIGGVTVEAVSNAVQFNPKATVGVAIQQTEEQLRLLLCSPRAVVVNFDDGDESVYTNAFPELKKYGIPGSCQIITGSIGTAGYCTEYQLRELKEAGWCIDSHTVTHPDLTTLNEAQQRTELSDSMDWLRTRGFDYHIFASPGGKYNDTTLELLRKLGYRLHRNYTQDEGEVWPIPNIMAMKAKGVNVADAPATVIGWVDTAMSAYEVVNLTFHKVEEGGAATQYPVADFQTVIQGIAGSGYPFYTLADILDAWELGKAVGKVEQFGTDSTATIDGITDIYVGSDHAGANHFDGTYVDWFATGDFYGVRELAKRWGCKW